MENQTKGIDQAEEDRTQHIKSYNCNERNTYVDLLKYRVPALVVRGKNKSEGPENQSQDTSPLRGNTSGARDDSAKNALKTQIHVENDGTKSGERQSLVVNLKDKGDISVRGKDNNEVLMRLREGVCDLANIYTIQGSGEKEEDVPAEHLRSRCSTRREDDESSCDNPSAEDGVQKEDVPAEHLRSRCTTRREDDESCCDNPSAEDGVQKCASQSDLVSANSQVMEGCQSCAHIYKGSSKQATSNSQTQTANHIISRAIVTDTDTSTHTTCSSQTVSMGQRNRSAQTACSQKVAMGQRNRSAQTSCSQTTQECQATPVYTIASCQTSVPKSDNIPRIILKPWAARKYNDMCICAELGVSCTCANRNVSSWEMVLPRNSSWWPTLKKIILIIAAIIPFIFLIVYSIYYYRFRA